MQIQIKRVVLLGLIGGGKTTFFNKITKSKLQTSFAGASVTRQIVKGTTQFANGFEVIDTPGFESDEQVIVHTAGILAALSYGNVNRILIIVKLENREALMIKNIKIPFEPLFRFKNLVTVIITHWDHCESDQQKVFDELKKKILEKLQIKSVLKISKNDDPETICSEVEEILFANNPQELQQEQVQLLDSEIYKYFNLLQLDKKKSLTIRQHRDDVIQEFKKVTFCYKTYISQNQNFANDIDQQEILHQIILKVKEEANKVVEGFETKFGEEIVELVDEEGNNLQYLYYITLKKAILMDVQDFIQYVYLIMKSLDQQFFKFLKKCPNCGLIWLKVIGCDGETYCGDRVASNNDEFVNFQRQKKVIITRENEKVRIERIEETVNQHLARIKLTLRNLLLQEKNITKHLDQPCDINLDQVLQQLINERNINNLPEYEFVIRLVKDINKLKGNMLQIILFNKGELLYSMPEFNQSEAKGIGCRQKITWSSLLPLSDKDLKEVLSTELLEYFADQEQLQNDEIAWLDKHYKEILKNEIKKQLQNMQNVTIQQQQ